MIDITPVEIIKKHYFLIDKRNNQVVSYSKGKNKFDDKKFNEKLLSPTKEEWKKITKGYLIFYKDKFWFEKSPTLIREENMDDITALKKKLDEGTITPEEKNQLISKLSELI